MNILKALTGNQVRSTLLEYFAKFPKEEIQFGELQKKLALNPRQLTLQLQKLRTIKFLHERREGNKKFYTANRTAPYFEHLTQFIHSLAQGDMFRWERAATIHHLYIAAEASMEPFNDYFGVYWPTAHMIYTGENVLWTCENSILRKVGQHVIDWYHEKGNNKKYHDDVEARTKTLEKILKVVEKAPLSQLTNAELLKLYKKAHTTYIEWYALLWTTEPVAVRCEELLNENLDEVTPQEFSLLTAATKRSFSQEIEEDLDALLILARKKKGNFSDATLKKAIKTFQQNYFWMYNNYFETRVVEEEEIILDLKKRLKSDKKSIKGEQNVAAEKQALIKKLKIDGETQKVLDVANDFIYWQDLRKKWIMIFAHYLEVLLAEFAQRSGVSMHDIRYTMSHELKDVLAGKKIDFAARQENCMIVVEEGRPHGLLYLGEAAKKEEKRRLGAAGTPQEEQVLKGNIACSGKAMGTVKVLMNPTENYKVNHGDILVTSMTSPDFMESIRKCVAIVTNEGGITCHAAVIARELNIPCIIATKNATQVLKDGDMVEVDADTGIVSIVQ